MDPLWLAMSKLRRGKLQECNEICDRLRADNSSDQAVWLLSCISTVQANFIDETDDVGESLAETILDENALASVARPGTSLVSSHGNKNASFDPVIRPVSQSGRPMSGFTRPSTTSQGSGSLTEALKGSTRMTTARPMTTMGREVRLNTASFAGSNANGSGRLVDCDNLNVKYYASKNGLAMALVEYLLGVEHNIRKALDLCVEATKANDFKDWWWKARLGKCYFKLGLFREAESQFKSSLKNQPIINTYLDLCNVYIRLDLPNTALDVLTEASEKFTCEPRLLLGLARIYDQLNDPDNAIQTYKRVLSLDASCIESIVCLGAHFFYSDQPELSMRYYRRLLQMEVNVAEVWNNIGLCCFFSSQYDMALGCFERALTIAGDDEMGDIWYNIGHIGISLGDLGLAYQAFKVAVSISPYHGEALNNIAVLEMRRQKFDVAKSCLSSACDSCPHLFEPLFNSALMSYRMGDFQDAFVFAAKGLGVHPGHLDSKELQSLLQKTFLNT